WDTQRGTLLMQFEGHEDWIRVLSAVPEGRFASGSDDKTIRLRHLSSGASLAILKGHTHPVRALASLSGGRMASASSDMTIRIWDIAHEAEINCFIGHESLVSALASLSQGRLASAASGVIALWEVATGRLLATLKGHGDWVTALA